MRRMRLERVHPRFARWGAEMNSAPQTPHLLFLANGKRGELRSQPDNAAAPESAGGASAKYPKKEVGV